MKLRTVWGVLPVFILKSKDGWGHARGPILRMPAGVNDAVLAHELFHVKQWYVYFTALTVIAVGMTYLLLPEIDVLSESGSFAGLVIPTAFCAIGLLFWNSEFLRWRRETAAYGETCRASDSTAWIQSFAEKLVYHPNYAFSSFSVKDTAAQIRLRRDDGKLF